MQQEIFEKVEILHSELQEIKEQITQKEHSGIDIENLFKAVDDVKKEVNQINLLQKKTEEYSEEKSQDGCKVDLEKIKQKQIDVDGELKNINSSVEEMQASCYALKNELAVLKNNQNSKEDLFDDFESTYKRAFEGSISKISDSNKQIKDEIAEIKNIIADHQTRIIQLESSDRERTDNLNAASSSIFDEITGVGCDDGFVECTAAEDEFKDLSKKADDIDKNVSRLKDKIASLEEDRKDVNNCLQQLKNKIGSLEKSQQGAKNEISNLNSVIESNKRSDDVTICMNREISSLRESFTKPKKKRCCCKQFFCDQKRSFYFLYYKSFYSVYVVSKRQNRTFCWARFY